MTVEELARRMSWAEFQHWLALERIDPLPDPWLQTGITCASNVNLWRGKKARPARPDQFIPKPRRVRRQSVLAMQAAMSILRKPPAPRKA